MRKIITAFILLLCATCMASAANYLTFTAEEDSSTFGIDYYYLSPDVQYSLDGGASWAELTVRDTILLAKKGDKALIRGYNENGLGSNGKQFVHFVMTGAIAASGSVMSLIDGIGLSTEIPNEECFYRLFENCMSLTQAPELPATTLAVYCYRDMFKGCTSLTHAPELPATTLAKLCYEGMFSNCTSLTQAPELPATTLGIGCYAEMFSGCTSLTQVPKLPATTLTNYCYYDMFSGCTSLTQAPELPAATLAYQCYYTMFEDCTSLTKAPELPATTLDVSCYYGMFKGCNSLSEINVSFDDWNYKSATSKWVENVASSGTFTCPKTLALEYGVDRIPESWIVKYNDDTIVVKPNYLTFTAEEDGSTFGLVCEYLYGVDMDTLKPNMQYSLDEGETWMRLMVGDTVLLARKGEKALIKGYNAEGLGNNDKEFIRFFMTGSIAASGNVMSLIDGAGRSMVLPAERCFYGLFKDCASLTQAPELPATTLTDFCYDLMFSGCKRLTVAPALPAKSLAVYCYYAMFSGCTSLTQAPELPATGLAKFCYSIMFSECESLTKAPSLPASDLPLSCYSGMFRWCKNLSEVSVSFDHWLSDGSNNTDNWLREVAPTGTFICPAKLPVEYGMSRIPKGWAMKNIINGDTIDVFVNYLTFTAEEDSSSFGLKNDKKYPDVQYSLDGGKTWTALTNDDMVVLANKGDYALLKGMNLDGLGSAFSGQGSHFTMTGKVAASGNIMTLIEGPSVTLSIPASYCFSRLFSDCTSLTQAPELPATTLAEYCYAGMFSGCTSLTQTPALPAMTLADCCYESMFAGCTSLTKVAYLPASALKRQCYGSMFANCTSLTKAPTLPALALNYYCYASMFKGCTGLTEAPELPATTMWAYCYGGMFMGCTNLTKAPALPTVDLTEKSCYAEMFSGCTSLSEIEVSFEKWSEVYSTYNWVDNVAPSGTFICPKGLRIECGISGVPEGWVVKQVADGDTTVVPVVLNYLAFTAEKDSSSFKVSCAFENQYPDVQYSLDEGKSWINLKYGSSVTLVKSGDRALIRGYNPNGINTAKFVMTGRIAASGSIMSLIDGLGMSLVIPSVRCFDQLFYKCTSLTVAPELPATKLAISCYKSMFNGCVNLTKAPELPANTLSASCYSEMFSGCTGLTKAPELPAKTLQTSCYYDMFSGCTGLSEIGVFFEDWIEGDGTTGWVRDVASTGTFICPKALALEYGDSSIPNGWRVKFVEDTTIVKIDYLTFLAEEDSSSFGIIHENGNNPNVMYSLDDGESWLVMEPDMPILLGKKGDKALLKGYNPEGFSSNRLYSHFSMSGKIAASGSVMSLVDGFGNETAIPNEGCFTQLFFECSALTQAPELPAVDLKDFCYYYMFQGCTGLIKTPELPAVVLAKHCYAGMFDGCISLAQAPSLPSATLAEGCYKSMFSGCTSLTLAPELPALSLQNGCYYNMFAGCENLTQAPELPAMELAEYCYGSMFFNCPNLVQASALPASALAYSCYESMFQECTSLAQAPELPATELQESCYSYMFSGCASLKKAPELPAPALKIMCYEGMFRGCTTMSEIKVSFKDWMIDGASSNLTDIWVYNVAPTGTFICPKALAEEYGESRIPEGWTVEYSDDTTSTSNANYLTFTAEEDSSTITATDVDADEEDRSTRSLSKKDTDLQYSTDGGKTWNTLENGVALVMPKAGDSILFKGYNPNGFSTESNRIKFVMTGAIAASGTVMSLIDEYGNCTEIPNEYCFANLFENCSSLTQAPELTATVLEPHCYQDMFSSCTGLRSAPAIPAEKLEEGSCNRMFYGCENLSEVKVSFTEWTGGTEDWLYGVSPTGTFICPDQLDGEINSSRIPEGWLLTNEGAATGTKVISSQECNVWTEGLTIIVSGATGRVEVYDASGAKLKSESSAGDACTFTMPAHGVYMVRTSKRTVKVVL